MEVSSIALCLFVFSLLCTAFHLFIVFAAKKKSIVHTERIQRIQRILHTIFIKTYLPTGIFAAILNAYYFWKYDAAGAKLFLCCILFILSFILERLTDKVLLENGIYTSPPPPLPETQKTVFAAFELLNEIAEKKAILLPSINGYNEALLSGIKNTQDNSNAAASIIKDYIHDEKQKNETLAKNIKLSHDIFEKLKTSADLAYDKMKLLNIKLNSLSSALAAFENQETLLQDLNATFTKIFNEHSIEANKKIHGILDNLGGIAYKCAHIQSFPRPYKEIVSLYSAKIESVLKVLERKRNIGPELKALDEKKNKIESELKVLDEKKSKIESDLKTLDSKKGEIESELKSLYDKKGKVNSELKTALQEYKKAARLHTELNGAGMRDPKEALEYMLLDEIFGPFCDLFRWERVEDARKVFSGESDGPDGETLGAVERFLAAAKELRNEAAYDPFAGGKGDGAAVDVKTAAARWEKTLLAYAASFKDAAAQAGKSDFAAGLRDGLANGFQLNAFIYGYTVFGLCASIAGKNANGAEAVTLFEFWHFDRKMCECFGELGIDGGAAYRFIEIAKSVNRRLVHGKTGVKAEWAKSGASVTALSIAQNVHDSEDFRRLIGVNEWGGVDWFNKEAFEEALFYAAAIAAGYAGIEAVSAIVAELSGAELKSEYKLPEFIKALGGKKSVKKEAGTAAAKPEAENEKNDNDNDNKNDNLLWKKAFQAGKTCVFTDPDNAIAKLNEAIRINPKYAASYFHRGMAYEYKDEPDYTAALQDYQKASELNPNSSLYANWMKKVKSKFAAGV
jgi:hypothetical protein